MWLSSQIVFSQIAINSSSAVTVQENSRHCAQGNQRFPDNLDGSQLIL